MGKEGVNVFAIRLTGHVLSFIGMPIILQGDQGSGIQRGIIYELTKGILMLFFILKAHVQGLAFQTQHGCGGPLVAIG